MENRSESVFDQILARSVNDALVANINNIAMGIWHCSFIGIQCFAVVTCLITIIFLSLASNDFHTIMYGYEEYTFDSEIFPKAMSSPEDRKDSQVIVTFLEVAFPTLLLALIFGISNLYCCSVFVLRGKVPLPLHERIREKFRHDIFGEKPDVRSQRPRRPRRPQRPRRPRRPIRPIPVGNRGKPNIVRRSNAPERLRAFRKSSLKKSALSAMEDENVTVRTSDIRSDSTIADVYVDRDSQSSSKKRSSKWSSSRRASRVGESSASSKLKRLISEKSSSSCKRKKAKRKKKRTSSSANLSKTLSKDTGNISEKSLRPSSDRGRSKEPSHRKRLVPSHKKLESSINNSRRSKIPSKKDSKRYPKRTTHSAASSRISYAGPTAGFNESTSSLKDENVRTSSERTHSSASRRTSYAGPLPQGKESTSSVKSESVRSLSGKSHSSATRRPSYTGSIERNKECASSVKSESVHSSRPERTHSSASRCSSYAGPLEPCPLDRNNECTSSVKCESVRSSFDRRPSQYIAQVEESRSSSVNFPLFSEREKRPRKARLSAMPSKDQEALVKSAQFSEHAYLASPPSESELDPFDSEVTKSSSEVVVSVKAM